ncbi:MAG: metal ABC transporter permease [Alphaproteobacteria bacterium]|nr:metal ABC transporter permease [Alphaproteobacteria bacterium]
MLLSHVPLGQLVLERGIVFVDLAVAQVAGLGLVVAAALGWETGGPAAQAIAVGAALGAAALLVASEARWPALQEAVIGSLFAAAASAEVLILSQSAHAAEHLKDLLVGQILWVSQAQLAVLGGLGVAVVWARAALDLERRRFAFYAVLALTVTASVQVAGVLLVFATLVLPAMAGRFAGRGLALGWPAAAGALGFAIGLGASAALDLPTGAAIVCGLALVATLSAIRSRT